MYIYLRAGDSEVKGGGRVRGQRELALSLSLCPRELIGRCALHWTSEAAYVSIRQHTS